jgi:ribonuclease HI
VVVLDDNENLITTYSEKANNTTNNKMELSAILWAFLKYGSKDRTLTVYSDSAYCVNTLTNWVFSWEKNNWKKANNQPPENLDLIKPFFNYL